MKKKVIVLLISLMPLSLFLSCKKDEHARKKEGEISAFKDTKGDGEADEEDIPPCCGGKKRDEDKRLYSAEKMPKWKIISKKKAEGMFNRNFIYLAKHLYSVEEWEKFYDSGLPQVAMDDIDSRWRSGYIEAWNRIPEEKRQKELHLAYDTIRFADEYQPHKEFMHVFWYVEEALEDK